MRESGSKYACCQGQQAEHVAGVAGVGSEFLKERAARL